MARSRPTIRRILLPVDFTPSSKEAVSEAEMIARRFGSRIELIHVIERFTYSVTDTISIVDHYRALNTIAEPLMAEVEKQLGSKGFKVASRIVTGRPYAEILKRAKASRADLIVMGTHGRSGLEHFMLGSVAERVVRLSSVPVLTVRGRGGVAKRREPRRRGQMLIG